MFRLFCNAEPFVKGVRTPSPQPPLITPNSSARLQHQRTTVAEKIYLWIMRPDQSRHLENFRLTTPPKLSNPIELLWPINGPYKKKPSAKAGLFIWLLKISRSCSTTDPLFFEPIYRLLYFYDGQASVPKVTVPSVSILVVSAGVKEP